MALTEDAKAEIATAIAIVRSDKFEQFARATVSKHLPAKDPLIIPDPPKDPKDPKNPPTDPVVPPPAKDPKDPVEPPKGTRSKYWGEILDD